MSASLPPAAQSRVYDRTNILSSSEPARDTSKLVRPTTQSSRNHQGLSWNFGLGWGQDTGQWNRICGFASSPWRQRRILPHEGEECLTSACQFEIWLTTDDITDEAWRQSFISRFPSTSLAQSWKNGILAGYGSTPAHLLG